MVIAKKMQETASVEFSTFMTFIGKPLFWLCTRLSI